MTRRAVRPHPVSTPGEDSGRCGAAGTDPAVAGHSLLRKDRADQDAGETRERRGQGGDASRPTALFETPWERSAPLLRS